jgi:putative phage-type endonuclease
LNDYQNDVDTWQTPYGLWLLRTGRKSQEVTPAMQHGTDMEPAARAAYEKLTGQVMEPLVLTEGDYSASLDGITLDGTLILEVKCPFKGCASELWKAVAAGEVPAHYWWQVVLRQVGDQVGFGHGSNVAQMKDRGRLRADRPLGRHRILCSWLCP